MNDKKEVWLRGEMIPGVSLYLQPAAHALLQAKEEIHEMMNGFPEEILWKSVSGLATPGFHLKHIAGVLDRLLTYAEAKPLSEEQLAYLSKEKDADESLVEILELLNSTFERTISRFTQFSDEDLKSFRDVGRAKLPSTVIGLCFHAAEHTMRHTGQLLVTVKNISERIKEPRR